MTTTEPATQNASLNHATNRRSFLSSTAGMLGLTAVNSLLAAEGQERPRSPLANPPGVTGFPQFMPRAKQVIFLFQAGGPSQIDMLDHKPQLQKWHGKELPKSVMQGAKFTGMVSGQASFPVVASPWSFQQTGQSGAWVSELTPEFAKVVDEVCVINSMTTPEVDHGGGTNFILTGHRFAGRPTAGAWAAYGLGSECNDLPAFVVLRTNKGDSSVLDRHWGSGFLPSRYQGVKFGSGEEPVQYLNNAKGMNGNLRGQTIRDLTGFNRLHYDAVGDPEIETRIAQYEMAFRMQMSVPELADLSDESKSTIDLYGQDASEAGTYANSALMARRLVERGVRFVQVIQGGWDHHAAVPKGLTEMTKYTDRANAALITDLKQRGLLDDTLVIWGGEFGRTVFCQGVLTANNFGREHHGLGFTMWAAGGGIKPGIVHGATDEWSFHVTENPVTVNDLHATMLHQLGINHQRLTYRYQGRDFRLTDLAGKVVEEILA